MRPTIALPTLPSTLARRAVLSRMLNGAAGLEMHLLSASLRIHTRILKHRRVDGGTTSGRRPAHEGALKIR